MTAGGKSETEVLLPCPFCGNKVHEQSFWYANGESEKEGGANV